ncbi:MAG: pseudaminic acid synthase [Bacteroidota bacterium]
MKQNAQNNVLIIAELSANHNQDIKVAIDSIKAAKFAGADAIKIQTYTADTLTIDCDNEYFRIKGGTLWDGKTLYQLYKEAYTPWEWQQQLKEYAESLGLIFFSTPFDKTAVDFLEQMNVQLYKISSFEITDTSLIEYTASKGKPMIISTGIATLDEIEDALIACRKVGNNQITLLKCTSQYPAPIDEANLLTIPDMKKRFGVDVGLSDHTIGDIASITAVALGASVVEKHFILNRNIGGPDACFSMEPKEFKIMVESIRKVEKALGKAVYEISDKAEKSRIFSRSLFVVKKIKKGDTFTSENIRSIRPGHGLKPKYLNQIIGKKATKNIDFGTPLLISMVQGLNL